MKRAFFVPLMALWAIAVLTGTVQASVDWKALTTVELEKDFLSITHSLDGRWAFVLTPKGEVLVYSSEGNLEDRLQVGGNFDKIESSPTGDKVYLSSRSTGKLQVLEIEFVKQIDIAGSPSRGPSNAPVKVVLFTDFE